MLFLAEMCSHSHMSNPSKKHGSCTLHPHLVIEKVFWKMSFFHNDLFNKPVQMCMVACYTQYDVWYKWNNSRQIQHEIRHNHLAWSTSCDGTGPRILRQGVLILKLKVWLRSQYVHQYIFWAVHTFPVQKNNMKTWITVSWTQHLLRVISFL